MLIYNITLSNSNGIKNTWTDWCLIPRNRPHVVPPVPKTHYVDVPGRQGSIDLSEFLAGEPTYENRQGSWEFIVANQNISIAALDTNSKWGDITVPDNPNGFWFDVYKDIMAFLHGYETYVILSEDPDYRYFGRLSVNQWGSEEQYSTITIDYNLLPFKFLEGHSEAAISREAGGLL